jgi:hypothetical protein
MGYLKEKRLDINQICYCLLIQPAANRQKRLKSSPEVSQPYDMTIETLIEDTGAPYLSTKQRWSTAISQRSIENSTVSPFDGTYRDQNFPRYMVPEV